MGVLKSATAAIFLSTLTTAAPYLNWSNTGSIAAGAQALAADIFKNVYWGGQPGHTVGLFSENATMDTRSSAAWWVSGAVWDSLIEYWARTGDGQHNSLIAAGLMEQAGPNFDFQPDSETAMFNDDIAFWANVAMTAAERRLPQPDNTKPAWNVLAARAFDQLQTRWGKSGTCGGGMPYAVSQSSDLYSLSTAGSNANYMQLAARLFRYNYVEDENYLENNSYSNAATGAWNWMTQRAKIITEEGMVFDSVKLSTNCNENDTWDDQWSIDAASVAHAAAVMTMNGVKGWNASSDNQKLTDMWSQRAVHQLEAMDYFQAPANVTPSSKRLFETDCELYDNWPPRCWLNGYPTYKGIAISWIANSQMMLPHADVLDEVKTISARNAYDTCTAGPDRLNCGTAWNGTFDNYGGFQQQAAVLQAVLANLPQPYPARKVTAFSKPETFEGEGDFVYPDLSDYSAAMSSALNSGTASTPTSTGTSTSGTATALAATTSTGKSSYMPADGPLPKVDASASSGTGRGSYVPADGPLPKATASPSSGTGKGSYVPADGPLPNASASASSGTGKGSYVPADGPLPNASAASNPTSSASATSAAVSANSDHQDAAQAMGKTNNGGKIEAKAMMAMVLGVAAMVVLS